MTPKPMTPKIKVAMDHVRSLFPNVVKVKYDSDGGFDSWSYTDIDGFAPAFDVRTIGINLLDEALNEAQEVYGFPCEFSVGESA